ncbi:MAG: hypothetical protein ACRDT1_04280 [Micromonosporaceae bacterium]
MLAICVALVAGVALAGCGVANGADGAGVGGPNYSKKGVALPSPSGDYRNPKPKTDEPGTSASPDEQILYDLQERVVGAAGVEAKTHARCVGGVITGTVDQSVTCKVRYRGLTVAYQVEIQGGSPTFTWSAKAKSGVLTAEGIGLAYWAKHNATSSQLRCDEMPEKQLVKLGEDIGFRCYRKSEDGWKQDVVIVADGEIKFQPLSE